MAPPANELIAPAAGDPHANDAYVVTSNATIPAAPPAIWPDLLPDFPDAS